jgi:hypothetical protein
MMFCQWIRALFPAVSFSVLLLVVTLSAVLGAPPAAENSLRESERLKSELRAEWLVN